MEADWAERMHTATKNKNLLSESELRETILKLEKKIGEDEEVSRQEGVDSDVDKYEKLWKK